MRGVRLLSTSLTGALLCCVALAGEPALPAGVPLPCGIADAGGRTGFVAGATGGIDVIDLVTGDLLWETREAQWPAAVVGDRFYALAAAGGELRLLAFDLGSGGACVFQSDAVRLPDGRAGVETAAQTFAARWHLARGRLVLDWEAADRRPPETPQFRLTGRGAARGAPPPLGLAHAPLDRLEPEGRHAAGRIVFDLTDGTAEPLPPAPPAPVPPLPHAAQRLAIRWRGTAGGNPAAVVMERTADGQALVFRAWDRVTGKELPTRELIRGRRPALVPTVDDRYLCLRDLAPSPEERPAQAPVWTVVAPETGQVVARVPVPSGTQALALVGARAYCLVAGPVLGRLDRPHVRPQTLRAVDLTTGKALWERPVAGKWTLPPA